MKAQYADWPLMAGRSALRFDRQYDYYECLGCGETIQVPWRAVLRAGHGEVDVREHPEHRMMWLEMIQLAHRRCMSQAMALASRGDDGSRTAPHPPAMAN